MNTQNKLPKLGDNKNFNIGQFYGKYGTLIILLGIFIIATIFVPNFAKPQNLLNVLLSNSVIIMLSYGATFVILLGQTNVAYGSLLALIGCVAALVDVHSGGNFPLAFIVALALGATIGLINGFITTTFNIPAFITTLAITLVARGAALLITNGSPVSGLSKSFVWMGQGYIGPFPVSVILILAAFIIVFIILNKTVFGRHVYAVGGNEDASRASGIKNKNVLIKAFLIDGIITAIAALMFMGRQASAPPAGGEKYEFDAITAVVVGGTSLSGGSGNVMGTLIGGLIVGIIINVQNLLGVDTYWQQIVRGSIILIAVIVDVVTKRAANKVKA